MSCLGGVLWCVPGCCAAPCCWGLCRLALRCCALCGFVLLRLVLPCAVLCPRALSVVLGSCAFWRRVLSCPPALCMFCCGVSLPTGRGCGALRAWGPVTNPTARALPSWLCALWGRHEGARGGALLPGCGASGVGRSPDPDCPLSGRAAGAHYPLAEVAGGCGRGDPSTTPQRALLRAVGVA